MNHWREMFEIAKETYQLDWGDHPTDGDWVEAYIVVFKNTSKKPNNRRYSREKDAERGAAQIFNDIKRKIEKAILG